MSPLHHSLLKTLGFALCTVFVGLPALADDTEIYKSNASAGARPNVLFIMDTSGSMDGTVITTAPPYDPSVTYSGSCDASRIYYITDDTALPSCSSGDWFPAASNTCDASTASLAPGGAGMWPALGNPRERSAQYRSGSGGTKWRGISSGNTGFVDCAPDAGVHGQTAASTRKHIRNSSPGWGSTPSLNWASTGNSYRFYTANYLNFKSGTGSTTMTRLQIVRDVALNLANSLQNVNLGLMRYNTDAEGGYVLNAIQDINVAANRSSIISRLNAFTPTSGSGGTPLSETFYEAAQYLTGGSVVYGDRGMPGVSDNNARTAPGSRTYQSPLQYQCQKSYIVYLTDGAPTVDDGAIADIGTKIGGACKPDPIEPYHDGGWVTGSGTCMDDLAAWLNTSDLSASLAGTQSASTFMVGFGNSLNQTPGDTQGYLNEIAKAGGTEKAYMATDVPTLTEALQKIFNKIQITSATFITPSISVNTFNRARTNTDLYFSLFRVSQGEHWPGNLKKYTLDGSTIEDAGGLPAVDTSGFFAPGTTSFWSTAPDGNDITLGGAVSQLPAPASRNLYTSLTTTSGDLNDAANAVSAANSTMNDALVGAGAATSGCSAECQNTINWLRGFDADDKDGDGDTTETATSRFMGDPLHGKPAVVTYGGSVGAPDAQDTVVYFPSNDGLLHAIDAKSGQELWAYIPEELLPRLHTLYVDNAVAQRSYGLDGDVQMLKFDKNQDGIVDPTEDKVYLFFGMRGGGTHYYGLDVTDEDNPQLLWSKSDVDYPGLGYTWSTPVVTRVNVGNGSGGSANASAEKFVLIFGGGYDLLQENQPYSIDSVGNRIFIVDAVTGTRLWYGGALGADTPDEIWPKMNNAIPGEITVIDTDGDKFADRMYAADMGGRVWRFDITNGQAPASLVAGGVIAQLGAGSNGAQPNSAARRFYNAPDVSLVQRRAEDPYYNIAIGSGYRGHPLDTVTQDRFYTIRDKAPYARLSQAVYNGITPILDGDLIDITANPAGSTVAPIHPGWKFILPNQPGHDGEKVLAEATTVNNVLLFTTFQPLSPSSGADPCYPANINRVYALFADSGKPALDFNDDGVLDNNDVSDDLNQDGIVGEVTVALIRQANQDPALPPGSPPTVCVAGVEVLKKCVSAGGTIRTFWQRDDSN
ncbi:MAG TPA: PilC/PilY family type IV pilus protein [Steroidobacteraceae bacterium]|nr:PilC/PilY family type IV pilus protein [Steroidobacteraceae bacterium]HQX46114.1 PilC/PilY family type IV pilus protein [Steroidobacteraceae bacterium]HQX79447.1 PilC/PilY family type IV pilus protein [Steroidobacteraceae bacterium]HQZ80342.1 PilC/PilY family type IV pilus protein [Steroidobacteraceae bacterium]